MWLSSSSSSHQNISGRIGFTGRQGSLCHFQSYRGAYHGKGNRQMTGILDSFGRSINYLRISVTDRCNLRCIYCMPPEGVPQMPHGEILSYEEIRIIVQAAAELGINKIRLTGGEPLVRADLPKLIKMLSRIGGIQELSLTTNGTLLKNYALELRQAGLSRQAMPPTYSVCPKTKRWLISSVWRISWKAR